MVSSIGQLTNEELAPINALTPVSKMVSRVFDVWIFGALCTIGYYDIAGKANVVTGYLRVARTPAEQVADLLKRQIHQGQASSSLDSTELLSAPITLRPGDIHAINQQFQMRQSFVATEGWVLGTMYLVHGRLCDVEVIITGNYHGMDQIPTSVALAVEIDAVQRLTDKNHAGYAIHIDGHTFYLPRG